MSEVEEKRLMNSRKSIKGSVTRIQNYVDSVFGNEDLTEIKIRSERLTELWNDYRRVQNQLEEMDFEKHENHRVDFEIIYDNLKGKIDKILSSVADNRGKVKVAQSSSSVGDSSNLRVSKISIPHFSGNYQEWESFRDIFVSVVDSNDNIPDVEKLVHLKTNLSGEALKVINSIRITADNYDKAWRLLNERFNNKESIINSHIDALFELPHVSKDTSIGLRNLVTEMKQRLCCLQSLNVPVESWDYILVYLMKTKLDKATKCEWELIRRQSSSVADPPKIEDFIQFLERRCCSFEAAQEAVCFNQDKIKPFVKVESKTKVSHVVAEQKPTPFCRLCKSNHYLWFCHKFLDQNQAERVATVKQLRLCFNCLRRNHSAADCTAGNCQKCAKNHHTLIHFEASAHNRTNSRPKEVQSTEAKSKDQPKDQQRHGSVQAVKNESQINLHSSTKITETLLATAIIKVQNDNHWHFCRTLLDSASQVNFVSKSFTDRLGAKVYSKHTPVSGISQTHARVNKATLLRLANRDNSFQVELEFLILDNITSELPSRHVNHKSWQIPHGISLADPQFYIPGQIEMLVGAEIFMSILKQQQLKLGNNLPILQNTEFGWVVSGKIPHHDADQTSACFLTIEGLENQISRFWEVEETPMEKLLSQEEKDCEEHFLKNTTRDDTGRFIVKLPFKQDPTALGASRPMAERRLKNLEYRLHHNEELKVQYVEFLQDYLNLGHMKFLSPNRSKQDEGYYLPHHPVVKDTSLTTKVRVVFDASASTSTGISLNQLLMVGPTIQDDLFSIVLRFRTHNYVLMADIEKMYRQIQVHEDHTPFQKILWRSFSSKEMNTYELCTVTYGTASAPFLAVRCLHKLADDEKNKFPLASTVVTKDFYVDDVLTGSSTREGAVELRNQLIELLQRGGFKLRKWLSNDPSILEELKDTSTDSLVSLDASQTVKTLGLNWSAKLDSIMYHFSITEENVLTKRKLLSQIARLFDPLGLLGPTIVTAKIMMQDLWQLKLHWDEPVPENICENWRTFTAGFKSLNYTSIARKVIIDEPVEISIHGFSDASEKAYGACLYLLSNNRQQHSLMKLICSKSRVAPLKKLSLPRLELSAAVLLARLYQTTVKSINLPIDKVYFWTDSSITLCWINTPSHQLKTFVGNRVAEVQKLTRVKDWRHINSSDNPADVLSRGCLASQLLNNTLWWHGPEWMATDESRWPQQKFQLEISSEIPELKSTQASCHAVVVPFSVFERYSSLTKLVRVAALCLRFIHNVKTMHDQRLYGPLRVKEYQHALYKLIRRAQFESFTSDIQHIKQGSNLESSSKLKTLSPFLDEEGTLRVGGRLQNSSLNFDSKHQIILPSNHQLTKLILRNEHEKLLHGGTQAILNNIRLTYWPIKGRSQVKKIIQNCYKCFRLRTNQRSQVQLMGNLPKYRVQPCRPFLNVGVDYGGPILVRSGNPRKPLITKAYIVLFICMATKAIHLELASSLSTEAFLSAFRRFTARRGKSANVYSDNGTNFQGANNELQSLQTFLQKEETKNEIIASAVSDGIQWHFIPPHSPNFGGLWEAGIKRVKFHIKRVIGETKLNYEELYTLLTQIESCINSRPLTPIHDDPLDLSVLTPGHFLIGTPLTQLPDENLTDIPINRLKRWQLVQKMTQDIWQRWSSEYLHHLQQRHKWNKEGSNLKQGDMVILKEDNTSPLCWKLARVQDIHVGKDNRVRVVTVKTNSGSVKRCISKLCPLPLEQ